MDQINQIELAAVKAFKVEEKRIMVLYKKEDIICMRFIIVFQLLEVSINIGIGRDHSRSHSYAIHLQVMMKTQR